MSMTGMAMGVSGAPWADAWLQIRSKLGMHAEADGCLQRQLLAGGEFGDGRILTGQATIVLRDCLVRLGVDADQLENVGSHSCKATLLSAAA